MTSKTARVLCNHIVCYFPSLIGLINWPVIGLCGEDFRDTIITILALINMVGAIVSVHALGVIHPHTTVDSKSLYMYLVIVAMLLPFGTIKSI